METGQWPSTWVMKQIWNLKDSTIFHSHTCQMEITMKAKQVDETVVVLKDSATLAAADNLPFKVCQNGMHYISGPNAYFFNAFGRSLNTLNCQVNLLPSNFISGVCFSIEHRITVNPRPLASRAIECACNCSGVILVGFHFMANVLAV
jgi:hypothetical protein